MPDRETKPAPPSPYRTYSEQELNQLDCRTLRHITGNSAQAYRESDAKVHAMYDRANKVEPEEASALREQATELQRKSQRYRNNEAAASRKAHEKSCP